MSIHSNHLVKETSPYLRQHADNPVDWYPWGEEALKKSREQDKPILLSIGYAACHWCHVMEHESFEDQATAELMNSLFICIKVDREERPDIDQIYMKFVQMTTGSGGWPLNVFLTPDQEPFYGGTYFPPDERYGRASWPRVLKSASNFYHQNKEKLQENIAIIREEFRKSRDVSDLSEIPGQHLLKSCAVNLTRLYDPEFGGLGSAPKFPAVFPLSLFLRYFKISGEEKYLQMVTHTLRQMSHGGIYDQIGGGFARYSVDSRWFIPHFEKMLYDNAQLAPLYLDTYLITGDTYFLQIAQEILAFVRRELLSPEGGFYSSLDADSEGVEGKFYVWEKAEIDRLLGKESSEIFCTYYNVSAEGNFEHHNILHVTSELPELAKRYKKTPEKIRSILAESGKILITERSKRVRPGLDDKVLTSWNGLMLSAFARVYQVTRDKSYKTVIEKNIAFMKNSLYKKGHLLRTYNKNIAKYHAYLDDYAFLIQGLLDAYEALFLTEYLDWAHELLKYTNEKFWDENHAGYFYTSKDQEKLIERMKDEHDQSIPSGTAVMMLNNLRFYSLTEKSDYFNFAERVIKKYADRMAANPYGYASYLLGLDFYLQRPKEIVLAVPEKGNTKDYFQVIFGSYNPNKVVVCLSPGDEISTALSASLLNGKLPVNGRLTAYVCHNFTCSPPVFEVSDLKNLLQSP